MRAWTWVLVLLLWGEKDLAQVRQSVAYLEGQTGHCTTFAVGVKRWLTAAHCLKYADLKINGEGVRVVAQDQKNDLALLEGPLVSVLTVSKHEPTLGEAVTMFGWPTDWADDKALMFFGHAQALGVELQFDEVRSHQVNMFHEGGGPGMSGGPITNDKGEVVGMVEGEGQYPSISIASPTVKAIRAFLRMK